MQRYVECSIMYSGVAASLATTGLIGSKALHNCGVFKYASSSAERTPLWSETPWVGHEARRLDTE
jgi:hypothetical protein